MRLRGCLRAVRVGGERRCLHPLRTNIPLKTTGKPENTVRGYLAALGFPDMSEVLLEFLDRNGGGLLETRGLVAGYAFGERCTIVVHRVCVAPLMPHLLLQHLAHQALSANDDLSALSATWFGPSGRFPIHRVEALKTRLRGRCG